MFNVRLSIKFRVFKRDFGTADKAWTLTDNPFEIDPESMPPNTRMLFNKFGVKLWIW